MGARRGLAHPSVSARQDGARCAAPPPTFWPRALEPSMLESLLNPGTPPIQAQRALDVALSRNMTTTCEWGPKTDLGLALSVTPRCRCMLCGVSCGTAMDFLKARASHVWHGVGHFFWTCLAVEGYRESRDPVDRVFFCCRSGSGDLGKMAIAQVLSFGDVGCATPRSLPSIAGSG